MTYPKKVAAAVVIAAALGAGTAPSASAAPDDSVKVSKGSMDETSRYYMRLSILQKVGLA